MRELAPGVHSLGTTKGGRVRAFIVDDGHELTLIDTLFEGDGRHVLEALRALGRRPADLEHIVITHAHRSHLGGAAALKAASGATVYSHAWEADIVSGNRKAQPVTLRPMQSLKILPFQLGIFLGVPKHTPCEVDEALGEGDRVGPLEVFFMPGHSPGHLTFFWPERRVLIAGDAIATWPELCPGWKAFTLNAEQQGAAIRRMAGLGAAVVGVGHGEAIVDDAADTVRSLVR